MATSGFLTALECTKFVFGLGELTALSQTTYSWFIWELLLRGRGGKEGTGWKGHECFDFVFHKAEH